MKIRAVLFDFDGTLANTMDLHYLAWKKVFKRYNVEIKKTDFFPLEGMKLIDIANVIAEKNKLINLNAIDLVNDKEKNFRSYHNSSLYPGVVEFIANIKAKEIKTAIVSAAYLKSLKSKVPKHFLEEFDTIITADIIKNPKPNPEPYLMASKNLNMPPDNCIVIENAPLGIRSAKNAGMFCIAICSTLHKEFLNESDYIVKEFGDLKKLEYFK